MTWAEEYPGTLGWYWIYYSAIDDSTPTIVWAYKTLDGKAMFLADGETFDASSAALWRGPIVAPLRLKPLSQAEQDRRRPPPIFGELDD